MNFNCALISVIKLHIYTHAHKHFICAELKLQQSGQRIPLPRRQTANLRTSKQMLVNSLAAVTHRSREMGIA